MVPCFMGALISFQQTVPSSNLSFDPLTATIVRLAAQFIPPTYKFGGPHVDTLGHNMRAISAGLGVAFAFAEAVTKRSTPNTVLHDADRANSEDVLDESL